MTMKRVKDTPKVDISEWNLEAIEDLGKQLLKEKFAEAVNEAIELAVENNASVYFAAQYDDKADPYMLHISLPLGEYELDEPTWKVSIKEAIEDFINYGSASEEPQRAIAVRDMLRELADMLDKVISENNSGEIRADKTT